MPSALRRLQETSDVKQAAAKLTAASVELARNVLALKTLIADASLLLNRSPEGHKIATAMQDTARDAERAYVELKTDITNIQRFFR